jgi:hypothetical protein
VDPSTALTILTNAELVLWLAVLVAAVRARLHESYPAILYFVVIKLLSCGGYFAFTAFYANSGPRAYAIWFDFYWLTFFMATLAVFFSIEQIIRHVLAPLEGLAKLAVIVFRFTGILTFFIAVTAHLPESRSVSFDVLLAAFFYSLALCLALFEVSLISLLVISAHRLGLSFRTRVFGLSIGFCLLGLMDFLSVATAHVNQRWMGLGPTSEVVTILALAMWTTYLLLPDQRRGPLLLKRESSLLRWDQVVKQLGLGPQPASDQIPSFMTDVEAVVERIMLRRKASGMQGS